MRKWTRRRFGKRRESRNLFGEILLESSISMKPRFILRHPFPISDAGSSASVGGDSGNSTGGSVGSVNSVDAEKAAAAAAAAAALATSATAAEGNHGLSTPRPPQQPPPRPQRQSMRPQQLAALVPSPSPEAEAAADDSSTLLGDDDLDRIETPVTPKQGRGQTT